jgi:hypothetical protein
MNLEWEPPPSDFDTNVNVYDGAADAEAAAANAGVDPNLAFAMRRGIGKLPATDAASATAVLANAVKVTLGPKGRNVVLNLADGPITLGDVSTVSGYPGLMNYVAANADAIAAEEGCVDPVSGRQCMEERRRQQAEREAR